MGFPSPAQDYVETRIDLNVICQVRPSVTMFDIDGVLHLMDCGAKPCSGDILCYELYGERAVGKLMGQSIITRDGETLEGTAMEDIVVLGKVTFMVSNYHEDSRPII
ncbi:hypothetical protein D0N50_10285 [Erwinia billingiae]|uniref:hypothetical protein n=1 Tax=Erwinia billingiae TaxID=182337 RepID=UPI00124669F6|nr:hypothetical protein [Erwinia billingiae]QEW32038.1 hypothetical protein D0N50_10285 [Erwinia billingiae]